MVTKPAPPERRRRKKGRPSLLDLQRRSLRLEKLHQQRSSLSPNPDPGPHSSRRYTRQNPNPASSSSDEDEGRAREKKLRLVLDAEAHTHEGGRQDSDKTTIGSPEDLGSMTPLPDKKLLVFILDRLQKKDTYGVFSEPVDPEELPDYHDIIEHPMDFGTVRKKLSTGAYRNLEQFEKDVFLISSNAMCYNAPDTIYYRQARSIQELARKNFENLRQESDDNEPEPKTLPRRGRPPSKSIANRTVGISPTVCSSLECSSNRRIAKGGAGTHLSNFNNNFSRNVTPVLSKKVNHGLCNAELSCWMAEHMPEKNEEYTGSGQKKILIEYGKEPPVTENCHSMYKQSQPSTCFLQDPLLTAFDKEKKPLLPIGLHVEYSYARSLARFAAKLGPFAWDIAATKIERALPPGTKFGPGWIGESEDSKSFQAALLTTTHPVHPSHAETSPLTTEERVVKLAQSPEVASNDVAVEDGHSCSVLQQPLPFAASNSSCRRLEDIDNARRSSYESRISPPSDAGSSNFQTNSQLHLNTRIQSGGSSFNPALEFYVASQLGRIVTSGTPVGSFGSDVPMTHAQALDMVSRSGNCLIHQAALSRMDAEREMLERSSSYQNHDIPMVAPVSESTEPLQLSFHQKRESVPPDLNIRFHSPGSPLASMVESQQFDLALQL